MTTPRTDTPDLTVAPVHYFAGPVHVTVHTDQGHRPAVMSATREHLAFVMFDGVSGEWHPIDRIVTGAETVTVWKA